MKLALFALGALLLLAPPLGAGTSEDIETWTSTGHPVFVVVTDRDAEGTDRALEIAGQAQARVAGSGLVTLDRGAVENRDLVRRYGVLGAPVPLVLVVAPNGIVAGGALLKDATPDVLVGLVPTPKKAEMLLDLSKRLPVFVLAMNPEMKARDQVLAAMKEAHASMDGKVATVGIDTRDEAEQRFLKELAIAPDAAWPVVVVFNAKGQKTAVFREPMSAAQLVAAARKKAECCPGGGC
jgi:hypothetical protein